MYGPLPEGSKNSNQGDARIVITNNNPGFRTDDDGFNVGSLVNGSNYLC